MSASYRVKRVLNNNAAISEQNGVDMLLLGPSIGFRKHVGDTIDDALVERSYILRDAAAFRKLEELFQTIPTDIIAFCMELIAYFQATLDVPLSGNIYISLPDHLYSSLQLYRQGIHIDNMMRWEIKSFFKQEYELGEFAVEEINKRYGVNMGEDEAAFIALHLINSTSESPTPIAMEITRLITYVVDALQRLLGIELDESSLAYCRLIAHIKYLAKRVLANENPQANDIESNDLLEVVKDKYRDAYAISERLFRELEREYSFQSSPADRLYLTIHIHKLMSSMELVDKEEGVTEE